MRSRPDSSGWLIVFTALFVALWGLSPRLAGIVGESPRAFLAAQLVLTVFWVGITIGIVRHIAGLRLSFWGRAVAFAISATLLVVSVQLRLWPPLANLWLIYGAAFLGCIVSVIFREPNILLPVALMSPLVDFWTVSAGPVRRVLEHRPEVLDVVAAGVPAAGQLAPLAFVGLGDFMFMAMFLAAADRLRMNSRRTAVAFFVLVSMAMILVVFWSGFAGVGVPGMVVIGLGFVAANLRHFRLSRQEALITSGLVIAVAILVAVIVRVR
ncbi:MAG: hypothetical protein KatS3mg024_0290 [Armatimonadota bacterium]|nr:MAG: hypothetical protein KatS3mg024_0290 [Armatimonadota bacterium]